jgi:hypothetical protein
MKLNRPIASARLGVASPRKASTSEASRRGWSWEDAKAEQVSLELRVRGSEFREYHSKRHAGLYARNLPRVLDRVGCLGF